MTLFDYIGSGFIPFDIGGGETFHLLLETGDDLLLETGDYILLESAP